MIVFERRIAWLFRAAVKRCFDSSGSKADQTPVQIRLTKDGLQMHASTSEITVSYAQPDMKGEGVFTFPILHFNEFESKSSDHVEIALLRPNLAVARWTEKGRSREIQIPLLEPESVSIRPEPPKKFTPLPGHFLTSLHDASVATAEQATKFVLNRVQLRGKTGTVLGSDSHQLFVSGGFKFPFSDDVLIPRSGIFGLQPFQTSEEASLGRTDRQIFIRTGGWTFAFWIDKDGRYPDVSSIIPRSSDFKTLFKLHAEDAQSFLDSLVRRIKGPAAKEHSVTLDLTETPCLRFEIDGRVTEVVLMNSEVTGQRFRVCLKLSQFLHALELRFHEFELRDPAKPIVARDGERIYLVMPIHGTKALLSGPDVIKIQTSAPKPKKALLPVKRRVREPIVVPAGATTTIEPAMCFDILGEAEGLRDGLFKVATHAGKILRFLRETCTQKRILDIARSSLFALGNQTAGEKV